MVLTEELRVNNENKLFQFDKFELSIIDSLTEMGGHVSFTRRNGFVWASYEDNDLAILDIHVNHHLALMVLFKKYVELKIKGNMKNE